MKQAQKHKEGQVECNNCRKTHPLTNMVQARPANDLPPAVKQVYLKCPDCGAETHSYYETQKIRNGRALLDKAKARSRQRNNNAAWQQYQKARKKFERLFNREQKRMARMVNDA